MGEPTHASQLTGYQPTHCGFCRMRGEACAKHGGLPSAAAAKRRRGDPDGNLDKPLPPAPAPFANPYNCSACGRIGSLCDMYYRMDQTKAGREGQTPIRAKEYKVNGHRIVKVTVGQVTITVQEPLA